MGKAGKPVLIGIAAFAIFVAWPFIYFRSVYDHTKRLREIVPGQVYRSGQLTAEGFRDAVQRYGIRTIINLQDELPDPDIERPYWGQPTIKETDLCKELGVRYVHLAPDLVPRDQVPENRPAVIDQFLAEMDKPENYPILFHCRAGLHRTGVLCAVYRMEYQGWNRGAAFRELRAHGFGNSACTAANDYVYEYVLAYQPRHERAQKAVAEVGRLRALPETAALGDQGR